MRLGLWLPSHEFRANPDPFLHGGQVEEVTCIRISWFNSRHNYTLDILRFVPIEQCESIKQVLLSHISDSKREGRDFELSEHPGVCVSRTIEDPEVELMLGLADVEA